MSMRAARSPARVGGRYVAAMPAQSDKRDRQRAILELVAAHFVGSQEELRRLLAGRGWEVTQSTLSRDLHEMRLARVPTADGVRYARTDGRTEPAEQGRTALAALLPTLFSRIDGVGELAVLHTVAGGAQPIAVALDAARWPDVLGTIGGDDTILVICRSAAARERVTTRLEELARGG